ncbi:uncharacterized protein N7511_002537, partial [Penicillium nucicola]|uniref:uncharacterized protein n=1 Tax=Penicillium nucicola TaxID=1850975 RepID=UPI0025454673
MPRPRRHHTLKTEGFYAVLGKRKFLDAKTPETRPLDVAWFDSDLESRSKRKAFKRRVPAIIDLDKTPKGWSDLEPDIHPEDYDAHIKRCELRIKENIMPLIFAHRLRTYETLQEERDELMLLEPGLSWEVVQRLASLERIHTWLYEWEQIKNVTAIMAAYRAQELRWNPRLVTYWSQGVQLCKPRPYGTNKYLYINGKFQGHTGFWVEG